MTRNFRSGATSLALLTLLAPTLSGCASGTKDEDGDVPTMDSGPSGCTADAACDDGVGCTVDSCDTAAGVCSQAPSDAMCEPSEMCDLVRGCVLRPPCEADSDCDDGLFCNGVETCDPATGCRSGEPPACDDSLGCTVDTCDPDAAEGNGACVATPDDVACSNGIVCDGAEACDPGNPDRDANGCVIGVAPVCDDGIACTVDTCSESAAGCEATSDDSACDDGVFCNGAEVCDLAGGCGAGTAPDCDDGFACTTDRCDAGSDACVRTPTDSICNDRLVCNGAERCDPAASSLANGCVGGTAVSCDDGLACTTDRCLEPSATCESLGSDADMDGYEAIGCGTGDDCNDLAASVHPGAAEVCDGVDNDCSGAADDGAGMECSLGSARVACTTMCGTPGTEGCNGTCRRTPCVAATETCNGCDDDGDGLIDDGFACRSGTTLSCTTMCATPGTQACAADCSGFSVCRAASETCNDCDDNGNGMIDEGLTCRRGSTQSCSTACGTTGSRTCALDCSGYGVCSATEVCNGCDDDADGVPDDGFACRQGQTVSCVTACGTAGTQTCNGSCSAFGTCLAGMETCGNGCDDDGNGMIDDGCGVPNDRCTSPYVLTGATGTRSDPFTGATVSVTGCGSGRDIWYSVAVGVRSLIYVDTLGSTFDTTLSIRNSCAAAALQCEDDDCGTLQEQLVRVVDPGTYYIAVHAFSSGTTSGTVSLRWQLTPAGNGTFTRITGNGTYGGTTSGMGLISSCGSGPEAGYYFTLCPGVTRTLTANTCTGTTFDSELQLFGPTGQIACDDDGCGYPYSSLSGAATGPGAFLLEIDGFGGSSGTYSVVVGGL